MKKIYLLVFILLSIPFIAQAQNPVIVVGYPELACLGITHKIPVTITGEFKAENKFVVQLRQETSQAVLAELPAVLKNGDMEVTYRDSSLSVYGMLQFRILSSSPRIESAWTNFKVHSKGIIRLEAAVSNRVNAGEEMPVKFTTLSSIEVDLSLSNGAEFEITSYSQNPFTTYHQVPVSSEEPLFIKTAVNACGPMQKIGQISPVINSTSVRTTFVSPLNVCEDGELKIAFSTAGAPFTPETKYSVRFSSIIVTTRDSLFTTEVPAELKDGVLVARFPQTLNLKAKTQFKVIILAKNPEITGAAGEAIVTVYPKPAVDFYTPDITVNVNEEATVGVIFKGIPPFSADLGDGSTITADYSGEVYVYKMPEKTTSYTIKTFSSGCGITDVTSPQSMVVTVNPGIAVIPESNPQILCVGSTSKIRIKTNGNFGPATSYTVHAFLSSIYEYTFPANRNGDYLEFIIPELPENTDPSRMYDNLNNLYVTTDNPGFESKPSYIYTIQSKPVMTLYENNKFSYDAPGIVSITYNLYGKWPFRIEDEQGKIFTIQNNWWAPEFYLDKTKDFKVKSVSNACFKTENLPSTRVTLTNTNLPGLYLEPLQASTCYQDSINVTIVAPGIFQDDNVFNIEAYSDCCNFTTVKTVRQGGSYKIKIPASQNNFTYPATVRVTSTNPLFISETYQLRIDSHLTNFNVNPVGTELQPALMLKSDEQTINFSATGGGVTSLTYSDGTSDKKADFENPDNLSIKISPAAGQTTTYTLKSITNNCGTSQANISTYIKTLPYQIKITDFEPYTNIFCSGSPVSIPFGISNGDAGNATFSLQIAREGDLAFTNITSGETTRMFKTIMPANLTEGYYQMRIISSDGGVSNIVRFEIKVIPSARLSVNLPEPVLVAAGQAVDFKLDFTGSFPWTAIYENNTSQTTSITPDIRTVRPTTGQDFSIKAVYNTCGYGIVSGAVAVQVQSGLNTDSDDYAACPGGNFTVSYSLSGDADLTSDYIRFELFDVQSRKGIYLDSTQIRQGRITLKIPSVLSGTEYQIRSTVRKSGLESIMGIRLTVPANVMLSGNTTINSGESTQLIIHNNNIIAERISYQLSDGKKGFFYGSESDSFIEVSPSETTTYTLTSVSNSCGAGKVSGSALVEVNPASERSVNVTSWSALGSLGFCLGDSIAVYYAQQGTFTASNIMSVQISDSTGKNFTTIPTVGKISPLRIAIPANLIPGKKYRLRVAASDPGTASGAFAYPMTPAKKAIARFASESVLYDGVTNPKIVVLLEGGAYWRYQFGTDQNFQTRSTYNSSDTITLNQVSPNQVYTLFNVINECGAGIIGNPSSVRVEVITAEPAKIQSKMSVAPNPTQDYILLRFESVSPRHYTLYNLQGISIQNRPIREKEEQIDIRNIPSGIYILQVEEAKMKTAFKIIKQ
ncbi:T9SS type A sorting domain-containing protein [Dyadobacter sp. NIV53]|uniref:T9SS type A sorting domain-containing protein n=1 Tax=Dyadobacter sp. NIV53 TaxID=2861765 RepID=UPI001C86D2B9|nr:T9SS type A sorting domain-containing protein [Dyadobacter sp. NIV53]